MRLRSAALTLLALLASASVTARADFNPIAQPDAAYTSSTVLVDITGIPNGTSGITQVSQAFPGVLSPQILTFDQQMTKVTVPVGWGTWGSPPETESSIPPVLYQTAANALQIQLSVPSTTFGFELQPVNIDSANPYEFQALFYEGPTLIGSVTRYLTGNADARLFAGFTTDEAFTSVLINNVDGRAGGFALAQLRFTPVPEPASVAMIAQAIVAVGFYGWRKRRQAAK